MRNIVGMTPLRIFDIVMGQSGTFPLLIGTMAIVIAPVARMRVELGHVIHVVAAQAPVGTAFSATRQHLTTSSALFLQACYPMEHSHVIMAGKFQRIAKKTESTVTARTARTRVSGAVQAVARAPRDAL